MVKVCPKCGTENDDDIFWCEKCNATLLSGRRLVLNKKITKNPYEVLVPKSELRLQRMEKILESEDYEYTYKKEKINIKLATVFNIYTTNFNENIKIEGSWEVKSIQVDGQSIPSLYDSATMTFYPDGTYELKSDTSHSGSSQTTGSTDTTQRPQTTQTTGSNDNSDKTADQANQGIEEKTEGEIELDLAIKGTWEFNNGKLYIKPADVDPDAPIDETMPQLLEIPIEYECIQKEDCIILNIKSSKGTTSLILEKAS